MNRPTPFELAFGPVRDRFEPIREELAAAGRDSADRDAFLLGREVAGLLHELRPDQGFGDATGAAAALLHFGYRFWAAGEPLRRVSPDALARAISHPLDPGRAGGPGPTSYVQLPPLAIWGLLEDAPPEPLDGWFVDRGPGPALSLLAVFGVRPGREGFTTLEVGGPPPRLRQRDEHTGLFVPIRTETGAAAGVGAVTSGEELLELCWRIEAAG